MRHKTVSSTGLLTLIISLCLLAVSLATWIIESHRGFGGHLDRLAMFFRMESTYYPTLRYFLGPFEDPMLTNGPQGTAAFPWASMIPHSLAFKLFGNLGFGVVEGLFHIGLFLLLIEFFRCFGLSRRAAVVGAFAFESALILRLLMPLAKLVELGGAQDTLALSKIVTEIFHPDNYSRIIRPLPSMAYYFMGLLACAKAWRSKHLDVSHVIVMGLGIGLAVGGYFLMGVHVGALAAFVVLLRLAQQRDEKRAVWKILAWGAGATFLALIPFLIQYKTAASDEVTARFGVTPALFAMVKLGVPLWRALFGLSVFTMASLFGRKTPIIGKTLCDVHESGFLPFGFLLILSVPFGQAIIANIALKNFNDGVWFEAMAYCELLVWLCLIAIVFASFTRRCLDRLQWRERTTMVSVFILCSVMAVSMVRTRAITGGHPERHTWFFLEGLNEHKDQYLPRFMALIDYLDSAPQYKEVLTFDPMVKHFLSAFRGKKFYAPDPVNTRAPDAEIEARFLRALKMLGVKREKLVDYLNGPGKLSYFNIYSLGHAKYSVSLRYSMEPISHYDQEMLKYGALWGFSAWGGGLGVGSDELRRFEDAYDRLTVDSWRDRPLDIIVLIKNAYEAALVPPREFALVWESDGYRVYRRRTL